MSSVEENLKKAAKTYAERAAIYGPSYKKQGEIIKTLFPHGLELVSDLHEDHVHALNRFALVNMLVTKLIRYSANFQEGGHQDSIHDLGVYAFMLEELDNEK